MEDSENGNTYQYDRVKQPPSTEPASEVLLRKQSGTSGLQRRKSSRLSKFTEPVLDDETRRTQKINMAIMTAIMSFTMLSAVVYLSAYMQWIYVRFQEEALGANFTKLNTSSAIDPCFRRPNMANTTSQKSPFTEQIEEAQANSARFAVKMTLVDVIPTFLTNILIGAYSDRLGRRFIFITAITGNVIKTGVSCVVAYWHLNVNILLVGAFLSGMCGDFPALITGVYVYTADNTTRKGRAMGMVIVQTIILVTGGVMRLANGYIIRAVGYVWPMVTGFGLSSIALVITIFFLRETLDKSKITEKHSLWKSIKGVFSFYFEKPVDPKYRRVDFVVIGLAFMVFGASSSDQITTIFLMNQPLCWGSTKIGFVTSISGLFCSIFSCVMMAVMRKCMSDEMSCIICIISSTAKNYLFAFAATDIGVYLAIGAGIMESNVTPLIRAIASKQVRPQKRGSLFASLAVIDVVTRSFASSGLSELYAASVKEWRGLTFFTVGCLAGLACCVMIVYKIIITARNSGRKEALKMRRVTVDSSTWTGEDNDDREDKLSSFTP